MSYTGIAMSKHIPTHRDSLLTHMHNPHLRIQKKTKQKKFCYQSLSEF